jgi:hypothetical protein
LRIRGKLSLLVTIPLVAMFVLTVGVVVNRVGVVSRAEASARAVRAANGVSTLLGELQQERLQMIGYLLRIVDRSTLVRHGATVTDRISDLRVQLGDSLSGDLAQALDASDRLRTLRTDVLSGRAAPTEVLDTYGVVDLALVDALHLADRAELDTAVGRQITALDMVLRLDETVNQGATLVALAAATGNADSSTAIAFTLSSAVSLGNKLMKIATADQVGLLTLLLQALNDRLGVDFYASLTANPRDAILKLSLATLFPAVQSFVSLGRFVERKISTDAIAEIDKERQAVLIAASGLAAASLVVFIVVVTLSIVIARAVVRPLTQLTLTADRVALLTEELVRVADDEAEPLDPVQIDRIEVPTNDEIGDLARSFERVRGTSLRLVERQVLGRRNVARVFGHVGRRTQNLVDRQAAMIDRLEREETYPRQLEQLHRLEHVSSRLRRNAGRLIVLSGAGAEEHMAPLPMADVVRLALGEIEDYARVDDHVPPGYAVAPAAIADLVLLFAELMENATAFSPPHTRVTVSMAAGRSVRVNIVDHGLGLSEQRIAEENNRISRRQRLDLLPTEVLGLHVVGQLARRHGMQVRLAPTPGGGITATVDIGTHLLVSGTTMPGAMAGSWAEVHRPPLPPHDGWRADASDPTGPAAPAVGGAAGRIPIDTAAVRVAAVAGINVAALDRASRILRTGRSWNAFAPVRRSNLPALPSAPADAQIPHSAPTSQSPPSASARNGPAGPQQEARPSRLQRRVPGAQLPIGASPPPTDTPPVDPATARALIEEFEAGVRRAQAGEPPPAHPASVLPPALSGPPAFETVTPAASPGTPPTPATALPINLDPPSGPRGVLVWRVPNATSDQAPRQQSAAGGGGNRQTPADPDVTGAWADQVEDMVPPAMRDIEPGHRDNEGTRP